MNDSTNKDFDLAKLDNEELRQWLDHKYPGRTVEREGNSIIVVIPVNFHRRNGRQTIKAKNPLSEQDNSMGVDNSVVSAIAKAYSWQDELESGEFGSIEELAKAKKVDRSNVGRILKLTSLSPVIVDALIDNDQSLGELSVRKLCNGFSTIWIEQDFQSPSPRKTRSSAECRNC